MWYIHDYRQADGRMAVLRYSFSQQTGELGGGPLLSRTLCSVPYLNNPALHMVNLMIM